MDLVQLQSFVTVADCGSLTKAAESLTLSQPTLSGHISKLEHELGRALFTRHGRGVALNDAGRAFRERAVRILQEVQTAKAELLIDPNAGRVTIAAIPTIAPFVLPDVVQKFRAIYPQATIEALELTTTELLEATRQGEIDLGIAAEPILTDGLIVEPLRQEELLLAFAESHRFTKQKNITWDDLADEPFLLMHDVHCLTDQLVGYCIRQKLAPLAVARVHQLATLLELIARGLGVSFVPAATATRGYPGCVLRSLSTEAPMRTWLIIRRKERKMSAMCQSMIELIKRDAT